ncbi:MAG: hypothetical protein V2A73_01160 [Pseudomonadota bacterium]
MRRLATATIGVAALLLAGGGGCNSDSKSRMFSIGVVVQGLEPGNVLVLQNNQEDELVVDSDGAFFFPTPLAEGDAYSVTVLFEPTMPRQDCGVYDGSGTAGERNGSLIRTYCRIVSHRVGGTVSGLAPGNSVDLFNGFETVTVDKNGQFLFPTGLVDGSTYAVSVLAQPISPNQTCEVDGGFATVVADDESRIVVACTDNYYSVGGMVIGLAGTNSVTLGRDDGDSVTITANGPFVFPRKLLDESTYSLEVLVPPTNPGEFCIVENASGTVGGADVTNVVVDCYGAVAAAISNRHLCWVAMDGSVFCVGEEDGELTWSPSGYDFVAIDVGVDYSCALKRSGSILCWGPKKFAPPDGNDFASIAAGDSHACAVKSDGSLACWGGDDYAQASPPDGTDFVSVAGGWRHSCAVKNSGAVVCWGRDTWGQASAPGGTDFVAVTCGYEHTCALKKDGSLACWGNRYSDPYDWPSGTDFIAVSAGDNHNCALRQDGFVICWGNCSLNGECTDYSDQSHTTVNAGGYSSCAVSSDGHVRYWGRLAYEGF